MASYERMVQRFGPALDGLEDVLQSKIDANERRRLASIEDHREILRVALLFLLAEKYDVPLMKLDPPIPPFQDAALAPMMATYQRMLGLPETREGRQEDQREQRSQLRTILFLPDLDPTRRLEFLESLDNEERGRLRFMQRFSPTALDLMVRVQYYRQHPEEAPPEARDILNRLQPPWPMREGSSFIAQPPRRSGFSRFRDWDVDDTRRSREAPARGRR